MKVLPTVNIIIPTYNQAAYINKAVDSVLAQDYPNKKILIVDDHSTDETQSKLICYAQNELVINHCNSRNLGRVANYHNALYNLSNADWVINLDGDDYFTNNRFISDAINEILKYPKDDILFFQGVSILKNNQTEKAILPNIPEEQIVITGENYFLDYFKRNSFSHLATLYNRAFAIQSSFYEMNTSSADIYSFLKLSLIFAQKKVIISKSISGVWLHHHSNASGHLSIKDHLKNISMYWKLCKIGWLKLRHIKIIMWFSFALTHYFRQFIGSFLRKNK
jgi:glycosyltransferase involved in cell wall biosynthesis